LSARDLVTGGLRQTIGLKFTWTETGEMATLLGNWWFGGGPEPAPAFIDGDILIAFVTVLLCDRPGRG
jgi:hypothetical protein